MPYDVIVIGAGLSGIAAAIRLAHYEKKVLLVERHHLPGGLNSFYRHNGRLVDTGLHAVTNFCRADDRQAPLNRLLRQLRIRREALELCEQTYSTICFPDRKLRFSNTFEEFETEIAEAFPDRIDGFRSLVRAILAHDPFALDAEPGSALAFLSRHIDDPRLRETILFPVMFYGNPMVHDMELNQFCIMFRSLFVEGCARPQRGMQHVLAVLRERLEQTGAEIVFGRGVKTIAVRDRHATHVVLDDGSEHAAEAVLSCAGFAETLRLCQGLPADTPEGEPGEMSFVETVFFLDRPPSQLGLSEAIRFACDTPRFDYAPPALAVDFDTAVLCIPGNFQDCGGTYADCQVRMTHAANHRIWQRLPEQEYRDAKQRAVAEQIARLEKKHPGFRDAVVDWDMFTPRTITRFTGHLNGSVYGSPVKHRDGRTPLDNVFVCGTDQGFLGIVGSLLSGVSMANYHLLA